MPPSSRRDQPPRTTPDEEEEAVGALKAAYEATRQQQEQASGNMRPVFDYECLCSRFLGDQRWAPYIRAIVDTIYDYRRGYPPMGHGAHRRETLMRAAKVANSLSAYLEQIDLRELVAAISGAAKADVSQQSMEDLNRVGSGPSNRVIVPSRLQPMLLDETFLFLGLLKRQAAGLGKVAETMPIVRHRPPVPDPLHLGCELLRDRWREARGALPINSMKHGEIGDFALVLFGPQGLGFSETEVATAMERALRSAAQRATENQDRR